MDKVTAEKTALIVQQSNAVLNQCLMDLHGVLDKNEYKEYCQKIGKVMGEIYCEILRPLWKEHPELLPSEMDGKYEVDQAIFKNIYEIASKQASKNS